MLQCVAAGLLVLELGVMIEAIASGRAAYRALSSGMLVLGQVLAMVFMHVEHGKGKRVPALLTLYWTLLLCVDVVRLRTFILKDQHGIVSTYEFGVFLGHLVFVVPAFVLSCMLEPSGTDATEGERPRCGGFLF